MRLNTLLVSLVGLVAAPLLLTAPTHATTHTDRRPINAIGTATTTIPDVIFWDNDCHQFPVNYTVNPDAYSPDSWRLQFDVLRTNGDLTTFNGIYSTRTTPAARTGRSTFQLCQGLDKPGLYTAKFKLTTESRTTFDTQQYSTQFQVRAPLTQTTLSLPTQVKAHQRTKATITVHAETPTGLTPATGYRVAIQYKTGHSNWKTIKGAAAKTKGTGAATVTFRAPTKGTVAYRATTRKTGTHTSSVSAPLTRS